MLHRVNYAKPAPFTFVVIGGLMQLAHLQWPVDSERVAGKLGSVPVLHVAERARYGGAELRFW